MDKVNHIYTPETLISRHTCKPITTPVKTFSPIFWCELCQLKLNTPFIAIQHTSGKSHKAKKSKQDSINQKRKLLPNNVEPDESVVVQEPATKKPKKQTNNVIEEPATIMIKKQTTKDVIEEPATKKRKEKSVLSNLDLKCDDCNLVLQSEIIALQHFKGKKHAKVIAAKITAKRNQNQRGGQRGRGRGRGYRGTGNDYGNGHGSMRGVSNNDAGFVSGHPTGEIVRSLANLHSKPLNNDNIDNGSSNDNIYSSDNHQNYQDHNLAGNTYDTLCSEIKDTLCSEIHQLKRKLGQM